MRLPVAALGGLVASALLPGCCCDLGPDRLTSVEVTDERGGRHEPVRFDGSDNELPLDAFFQAYRIGSPDSDRLRTVPMLELYDSGGSIITLARFLGSNPGGCAAAEIYEADEASLIIGDRYRLVHRASASPGDLEDSGDPEGTLAPFIVDLGGERALVAEIVVLDASAGPGGAGGGSTGGAGAGAQGGAGAGPAGNDL